MDKVWHRRRRSSTSTNNMPLIRRDKTDQLEALSRQTESLRLNNNEDHYHRNHLCHPHCGHNEGHGYNLQSNASHGARHESYQFEVSDIGPLRYETEYRTVWDQAKPGQGGYRQETQYREVRQHDGSDPQRPRYAPQNSPPRLGDYDEQGNAIQRFGPSRGEFNPHRTRTRNIAELPDTGRSFSQQQQAQPQQQRQRSQPQPLPEQDEQPSHKTGHRSRRRRSRQQPPPSPPAAPQQQQNYPNRGKSANGGSTDRQGNRDTPARSGPIPGSRQYNSQQIPASLSIGRSRPPQVDVPSRRESVHSDPNDPTRRVHRTVYTIVSDETTRRAEMPTAPSARPATPASQSRQRPNAQPPARRPDLVRSQDNAGPNRNSSTAYRPPSVKSAGDSSTSAGYEDTRQYQPYTRSSGIPDMRYYFA